MLKILSGGQTGVDRAALDAAIEEGIAYGGWCPKDGWAEDMPKAPGLRAFYDRLQETPRTGPAERTEWNVRDADLLLLLVDKAGLDVSQGSQAARDFAVKLGKPHAAIDLDAVDALEQTRTFLDASAPAASLCIAGPRESEAPGIYAKTRAFLRTAFAQMRGK